MYFLQVYLLGSFEKSFPLDLIRSFNDQLASTPLTAILEGLERTPKTGYYAAKADHVITLSTYIKRLR